MHVRLVNQGMPTQRMCSQFVCSFAGKERSLRQRYI
uniref:Uncharacterized protein n=1 Tax=Anguilla anguilla TaxID=7936 RepID=A0A0E9R6Z1_ANGAN